MGLVFFREGAPYVLEAVATVRYTPLGEWIERGERKRFVVKRLRRADALLTGEAIMELREAAERFLGRSYDLTFEWSDDRVYCWSWSGRRTIGLSASTSASYSGSVTSTSRRPWFGSSCASASATGFRETSR